MWDRGRAGGRLAMAADALRAALPTNGRESSLPSSAIIKAAGTSAHRVIIQTNMKTIAISIDEHILERIDRMVAERPESPRNRSSLFRQAVWEYIERLEQEAEEAKEREIFRKHRRRLHRQAASLVKEQAKP